jgi:N-acetylglucosamine kinase-like BadF-type ATPase
VTLALGVDGGNSKTIAVLATADGSIVGSGRGGCTDLYNAASPAVAIEEIERVVRAALASADAQPSDVSVSAFSLAGVDWPEDFALMDEELTRRLALHRPPTILNDAVGAIRCGTEDGIGVAAVCGTGGVTGARGRDGQVFHLGFWPDGSGGGFMGDQALRAVWRAALGTGPQTTLTERALHRFGATDPIDLLHLFTRRGGLPESHRALLAPAVLDEAAAGDPVANGIARRAAVTLAGQARVAAERAGLAGSSYPLVLAGGVFRHPSDLIARLVAEGVPDGRPVRARFEPAIGALLTAFDGAGVAADVERLQASMPAAELFAT